MSGTLLGTSRTTPIIGRCGPAPSGEYAEPLTCIHKLKSSNRLRPTGIRMADDDSKANYSTRRGGCRTGAVEFPAGVDGPEVAGAAGGLTSSGTFGSGAGEPLIAEMIM